MTGQPSGQVTSAEDAPLSYLLRVCEFLWPSPATVSTRRTGSGTVTRPEDVVDLIVLPSVQRPRLLVPARPRRVAARVIRAHGDRRSPRARARGRALSIVLGSRLADVLFPHRLRVSHVEHAESVQTYLRRAGVPGRWLSVQTGPPRANRKPVLRSLTDDGETAAFVKVGTDELTRQLVRHEAETLLRLSRDTLGVDIPPVLHHGPWGELELLALAPLPDHGPYNRLDSEQLTAAMVNVATVEGTADETLGSSRYWTSMQARMERLGNGRSAERLRAAAQRLVDGWTSRTVRFGAWHGDWSPWNMTMAAGQLYVWDWERFTRHVPVGFDALHFALQRGLVQERRDPESAARDCVDRAAALLSRFPVVAGTANVTALLYLLDLSCRYLADGQDEHGARHGKVGDWLLPALEEGVTEYPSDEEVRQ